MFNIKKAQKDFRKVVAKVFNESENKAGFNAKKFRKTDEGKIAYLTMGMIMEMMADPKKAQIMIQLSEEVNQDFENLKQDISNGKKELENEIKTQDIATMDEMVDEELENLKKENQNFNKDESDDNSKNEDDDDSKDENDNNKNESEMNPFLRYIRESDKNQDNELSFEDDDNSKNEDDDDSKDENDNNKNESDDDNSKNEDDDDSKDENDNNKNESFDVESLFGKFIFENEDNSKDESDDDSKNEDDDSKDEEEDLKNEGHGEIPQALPFKTVITKKKNESDDNDSKNEDDDDSKDECDDTKTVNVSEMASLVAQFIREEKENTDEEEDVDEEDQDKKVQESFIKFYKENVGLSHPDLSKSIKEGLAARCDALRESFIDAANEKNIFKSLNESETKDLLGLTANVIKDFLTESVNVLTNDTSAIVDQYISEEVYPALTEQVNTYITEEVQPELFGKFNAYMEYVAEEITNDLNDKKLIVASSKSQVQEGFINKLLATIKEELKIIPEQEDALISEQEKVKTFKETLSEERIDKARINQRMMKLQKENWLLKNLPNNVSESRKETIENLAGSLDESLSFDDYVQKSQIIIKESVKDNKKTLDKVIKEEFEAPKPKRKISENFEDFMIDTINRL